MLSKFFYILFILIFIVGNVYFAGIENKTALTAMNIILAIVALRSYNIVWKNNEQN